MFFPLSGFVYIVGFRGGAVLLCEVEDAPIQCLIVAMPDARPVPSKHLSQMHLSAFGVRFRASNPLLPQGGRFMLDLYVNT